MVDLEMSFTQRSLLIATELVGILNQGEQWDWKQCSSYCQDHYCGEEVSKTVWFISIFCCNCGMTMDTTHTTCFLWGYEGVLKTYLV